MTTHTEQEEIKDDKIFCSDMALDISVHEVVFCKHIFFQKCFLFFFFENLKGVSP